MNGLSDDGLRPRQTNPLESPKFVLREPNLPARLLMKVNASAARRATLDRQSGLA
jgi:hypothetical protein